MTTKPQEFEKMIAGIEEACKTGMMKGATISVSDKNLLSSTFFDYYERSIPQVEKFAFGYTESSFYTRKFRIGFIDREIKIHLYRDLDKKEAKKYEEKQNALRERVGVIESELGVKFNPAKK